MKFKSYFFVLLFILLMVPMLAGADIGYVVNNPSILNSDEIAIKNLLTFEGYSITIVDDDFYAGDYELIIVSEDIDDISLLFDNKHHKTLFLSNGAAKNAGLSSNSGSTTGLRVVINPNHEITESFPLGELNVYTSQENIDYLYGCKPINSKSLSYKSVGDRSVLLVVDENSLLIDGDCSNRDAEIYESNIFFGLTKASEWSPNVRLLFLNSVAWLINEEDNDNDGFYSDEDCDDEDAFVYPGAEELIDDIDQNCVNDAPVLIKEIEDLSWSKDRTKQINLNDYFVDPDGDEIDFSVYDTSEDENIIVSIDGGLISFGGDGEWIGGDWIIFKAEDLGEYRLSNEIILTILPINHAPVIEDYSPKGIIRIIENTDKEFSVDVFDVEGVFNIFWFLDDVEVGSGNNYLFNQGAGDYVVNAFVNDGEFDVSQSWDVFADEISEFTCEEADGFICSKNEFCSSGNLLGVYDTDNCCSVSCSPKFRDADRCVEIDSEINIEIEKPNENEEFKIGDAIDAKLKIENNKPENLEFDVEVYFYDISDDNSEIKKYENSVDIDEGKANSLNFEFKIPEDLDEENDYAVFVKIIEENELYCNENYVKVDIKREEHDVVIEDVKIDESAECGDYIYVDAKIRNIGSENEEVYLIIENSDLGIYEKTDKFEIERYEGKNEIDKRFEFKLPEDANSSEYEIKVSVFFDDEKNSVSKKLVVECVGEIVSKINKSFLSAGAEVKETGNSKMDILLIVMFVILAISLLGIYGYHNFNEKGFKKFSAGSLKKDIERVLRK